MNVNGEPKELENDILILGASKFVLRVVAQQPRRYRLSLFHSYWQYQRIKSYLN